jgi:uncharacterized protein
MIYIGLALAAVMLLLYMYIEAHRNRVIYKTVDLKTLPNAFKSFKIFFISDIHRRTVSDSIIDMAGSADIVIIGGDLVEKGVPMKRVSENINKLKQMGPVYFIWGNNDYDVNIEDLKITIEDCGAVILDNSCLSIYKGNNAVDIIGINDLAMGRARLEDSLADSRSACKILVSHNPDISKRVNASHQISLVLAGHTHGGQIRLGPLGVAQKGGWYRKENYQLLISNGYGATHLPLRLCAPSETHLITLR